MPLFRVSKYRGRRRIVPIMAPRSGSTTENQYINHIIRTLAIKRGGGFDSYTKEFHNCPPLPEPSLVALPDWQQAERLISEIVSQQNHVLIYGDYDCDGICSTVLMIDYLESAGLSPTKLHWFIPNRFEDSYGLTLPSLKKALTRLKSPPALVIAVDCGSPSYTELEYLRTLNVSTIVIDHHPVEPTGPKHPATCHLNPKGWAELSGRKDLQEMCAAGLVFLFTRAMAHQNALKTWSERRSILLAGLATVADVMPVFRINRILIKRAIAIGDAGHKLDPDDTVPGLIELHRVLNDSYAKRIGKYPPIDEETFGYEWGPCINANGRLDDARTSVKLLRAREPEQATRYASECMKMNQRRISTQRRILEAARRQALAQVGNKPPAKVILAVGKNWNIGVVGIVAARLREEFARPAIVCGMDATGLWRGSGRSVPGFELGSALHLASQGHPEQRVIVHGGGHAMAGGLAFTERQRPHFHNWINQQCSLTEKDFVHIWEIVAPAEELAPRYWHWLMSQLRPFGQGHPYTPILLHRARLDCFAFSKFHSDAEEFDYARRHQISSFPANNDESSDTEYNNYPDIYVSGNFQIAIKPNLLIQVYWNDTARARREWRQGKIYTLELRVRRSARHRYRFIVVDCWPETDTMATLPCKREFLGPRPMQVAQQLGLMPKWRFGLSGTEDWLTNSV